MTRAGDEQWPGWFLTPVAAAGGLCASAAFAPIGWWPLAFVAVGLLWWAVGVSRRVWRSVLLGWAFGLTFMATSLIWQTSILVLSYVGLTLVTSLFYAALGGLLHFAAGARWAAVWGAGCWSLVETVLSVFPFGGFAWMRLGYTQVDSPLAGFYPFTGAASVTFLVALIGHLAVGALTERTARRWVAAVVTAAAVAVAGVAGAAWVPDADGEQEVQVGWVQGGAPGGGVYGLGPARTIVKNQRAQTEELVAAVNAGTLPRPDFIVWPENATDMDPRSDAQTREAVERAVADAGVPILVGAIYEDARREERQTIAVWWGAEGVEASYAKRDLVPFGEWIPFRSVLLPLIPELAYVGYQSVAGTTPGVLDVVLPGGRSLSVGVAICFEVIFPRTLFEAVDAGAQVMVVQSSNAMYQGTNQIDQQFAITRVRAAEMRREILVVTTSGVSGLIDPQGRVAWTAPRGDGAYGVQTMTPTSVRTPVMNGGWLAERAIAALTVLGLLVSAGGSRRRRSS